MMPEPDLQIVWQVVITVAGITLVIERATAFWRTLNPPAKPPLHEVYTPLVKHQTLEKRVEKHEEKVDQRFADMQRASSASREKIYNSINDTREAVAGLRAEVDANNQLTHNIDYKLDRALERIHNQS